MKNEIYGECVNEKFNEDGSVREYPGCSIVSMIDPDSKLHAYCTYAASRFNEMPIARGFIMLPPSSYHMTVLQGFNDQVRKPSHWSIFKPLDTPMEAMDAFLKENYKELPSLGTVQMKYDRIQINDSDFRILLSPANEKQSCILSSYRDRASDQFGIRLPNHDDYRFHVSIAYVWRRPRPTELKQLKEYIHFMNDQFGKLDEVFPVSNAKLAYYNDMFSFPAERIRRKM